MALFTQYFIALSIVMACPFISDPLTFVSAATLPESAKPRLNDLPQGFIQRVQQPVEGFTEVHNPQHYVVFEQVGQMASSITYLHVAIPLNLSTFEQQARMLATVFRNLTIHTADKPIYQTKPSLKQIISDISEQLMEKLSRALDKLYVIDQILPSVPQRNKRFIWLAQNLFSTHQVQEFGKLWEQHKALKLDKEKLELEKQELEIRL